jgi:SHS family sialic acid transporter-like MFS transporter
MLAGAAPALLTLFIARYVPESERWKAAVKQGASHPLREIFSGALWKRTWLAITFASIALIGTWGSVQWLPLWADKLTGGQVHTAKALTQIMTATGAIITCLIAPILGGKIGRRPVYFLLCLASLGSCAYLFRCVTEYNALFLIMAFVVGGATAAFYGWLPLYLPELFPTRVRATGQGISYNFGRILAAFGALQMGHLMGYFGGSYAKAGATISLVYVLGMVLIWLAPETKGKPLPD